MNPAAAIYIREDLIHLTKVSFREEILHSLQSWHGPDWEGYKAPKFIHRFSAIPSNSSSRYVFILTTYSLVLATINNDVL